MKFSVERDVLADAVAWISRAVPARPPVPVLAGVHITATEDGLVRLASFDYEVSARGEFPASVETAGEVLVSGRLLREISNALPHKPVELSLEGTKVSVTCGASRFTLATMPVDQYPTLPELPEHSGTIDGTALQQAVAQVTAAASRDETLPILTGVRVEIEGSHISLLATDRYRLALRELEWKPSKSDISTVALVRAKTLADTAKALGAGDVTVALSSGQGMDLIGFEAGGLVTTSLLMDGDYPAVRRLFPDSSPIKAVVKTSELIEATRRVALVAERNSSVRLAFAEGEVTLDAGQSDDAQASEALTATLDGDPITVAFNPQYLLDGLSALGSEYVQLGFTQETKPVEFVGLSEPGGDVAAEFRYLLVPIRIAS
ncbi:DNA polymerase III subunit beta [Demequina sp. SYSU T00039]|uniref:Beta sliding clamp n=1 Tax=Demequina lignilytica TaxID=3051663 RepID=A0AAW7M8D4_9MICO|nr:MULTISPECIES: DNA polymerase III subunit beta [unclassified Demequina]MDN4477806.1 DNA polymerase III subunit beta [Demequina sp. SYSU T00039-1]MDN4487715.1 DNA polymerase III subunit beta [Demequina sp. SYSU T00039]MDN4490902.1 DNA polymerase III subunit beta [Demequina sp. SYSU T00068]